VSPPLDACLASTKPT